MCKITCHFPKIEFAYPFKIKFIATRSVQLSWAKGMKSKGMISTINISISKIENHDKCTVIRGIVYKNKELLFHVYKTKTKFFLEKYKFEFLVTTYSKGICFLFEPHAIYDILIDRAFICPESRLVHAFFWLKCIWNKGIKMY